MRIVTEYIFKLLSKIQKLSETFMKTNHQNRKEEGDKGIFIRMQHSWSEWCLGKLPCGDLAAGQQILFLIIPATLRQANGNLEMFGPTKVKSCKSTEQFGTKLIQVGLPS